MRDKIARITINSKTGQTLDIYLYKRNLRFKCKRCAVYCCKLGGPSLTKDDIKRIESAGYDPNECIEPAKERFIRPSLMSNMLKSNKDGSCIFLRAEEKNDTYKCSIYDVRPVLCRLYPFDFERIDANSFLLRIIACCKGLNNTDGDLVNEGFIVNHLLENILLLNRQYSSEA